MGAIGFNLDCLLIYFVPGQLQWAIQSGNSIFSTPGLISRSLHFKKPWVEKAAGRGVERSG